MPSAIAALSGEMNRFESGLVWRAISAKRLKAKRLSAPMRPLSPASSARGRLVMGRGAVMGASRQRAASTPMATASNGPTCALMLPPETVGTTLPYSTPATPPRGHNARRPRRHRLLLQHHHALVSECRAVGGRFPPSLRSSEISRKLAPLLRSWRIRDQALGGSAGTFVRSGGGERAASAAGRANHLRTRDQLAQRRPGGGRHRHGRRDTNDRRDERQGRVLVIRAGWSDHPAVPEYRLQAPHRARGRGSEQGRRDPRARRLQPRGGG